VTLIRYIEKIEVRATFGSSPVHVLRNRHSVIFVVLTQWFPNCYAYQ